MAGEPRTMPRIHHLTLERARRRLQAEGLPFTVVLMQSKAVPEGELISASPRPGTSLGDGREVVLTVSVGPPIQEP